MTKTYILKMPKIYIFLATVTFAKPDGQLVVATVSDVVAYREARAIAEGKIALAQWHKPEDLTFLNAIYRADEVKHTEPAGV